MPGVGHCVTHWQFQAHLCGDCDRMNFLMGFSQTLSLSPSLSLSLCVGSPVTGTCPTRSSLHAPPSFLPDPRGFSFTHTHTHTEHLQLASSLLSFPLCLSPPDPDFLPHSLLHTLLNWASSISTEPSVCVCVCVCACVCVWTSY